MTDPSLIACLPPVGHAPSRRCPCSPRVCCGSVLAHGPLPLSWVDEDGQSWVRVDEWYANVLARAERRAKPDPRYWVLNVPNGTDARAIWPGLKAEPHPWLPSWAIGLAPRLQPVPPARSRKWLRLFYGSWAEGETKATPPT